MKVFLKATALSIALCCLASAATLSLNSSTGTWISVIPAATPGLTGETTSHVQWGTPGSLADNPLGLKSGYQFNGAAPPPVLGINLDTNFLLGTFIHENNAIVPGTSISQVTLRILLELGIPDGPTNVGPLAFDYIFQHDETNNGASPCAYVAPENTNPTPNITPVGFAGPSCDDRVFIANSIPATNFLIGSTLYTLNLVGFSQNGGVTIRDKFYTTEDIDNSAQLFAKITAAEQTAPEPASFMLIGGGMLALGLGLRKRVIR
ncbi:MAG: THxN family PEP-CTERM protein [Candidatus Solibacter sp.]